MPPQNDLIARPPGPTSGIIKPYFANRAVFFDQVGRQFGPLVYFKMGFLHIYLVTDPDDVRQVMTNRANRKTWITKLVLGPVTGNGLLLSHGKLYNRQRRLIQPMFGRKRIQLYSRFAVKSSQDWSRRLAEGAIVEMESEMMALTLDAVGKSLFGETVGQRGRRVAKALRSFYATVDWVVVLGPLAYLIPHPKILRFYWNLFWLRRFMDQLIEKRRKEQPRDDLLSLLIQAEEDGKKMSRIQVRTEALTLLLAGHETTAVSLTWTWYLLSQNPDCEAKLHHEVDRVLQARIPTADDVDKLVYTKRVLLESLRLYPPAYLLDRNPTEDLDIRGYCIPKGSFIITSPYATHRIPEQYRDPERFDPDRWLPERMKTRSKHAYFPFGMGPRACLGQSFAWMESILTVATIAREWRFTLDPAQTVETDPKVTLRPRYGMRMKARSRQ